MSILYDDEKNNTQYFISERLWTDQCSQTFNSPKCVLNSDLTVLFKVLFEVLFKVES